MAGVAPINIKMAIDCSNRYAHVENEEMVCIGEAFK